MSSPFYKVALSMINGVGPVTARLLVSYCGSAEAIFKSTKKELLKIPNIGPETINSIQDKEVLTKAEEECKILEKKGIKVVFYLDGNYPARLSTFEESPVILYYEGEVDHFQSKRTVGIVGTRKPSQYGKLMTENLVLGLKSYNVNIISGLAHGVDALAHRVCVQEGIATIGFMGGGFDKIYPAANRKLARQMTETGIVASEFPFNKLPEREHFPMRNRVIAMMSDALVVIESGVKGGSMITAEFANRYNKDVFAFPGKITDNMSAGCNALIKQHKAALIESAKDISYILRWEEEQEVQQMILPLEDFTEDEEKLINILKTKPETHLDFLHYQSGLAIAKVSSLLLTLEFKGVVRSLPGKCYMLNGFR